MANQTQNFRVDAANHTGLQYQMYMDELRGSAVSDPKKYFECRRRLNEQLKEELLTRNFSLIYDVLDEGILDGDMITLFPPHYPKQKIAEISMQAVETIAEIVDDIIEKLMPASLDELTMTRLKKLNPV